MNEHTVHVHSVHTDAMNYNYNINNEITKRFMIWEMDTQRNMVYCTKVCLSTGVDLAGS